MAEVLEAVVAEVVGNHHTQVVGLKAGYSRWGYTHFALVRLGIVRQTAAGEQPKDSPERTAMVLGG